MTNPSIMTNVTVVPEERAVTDNQIDIVMSKDDSNHTTPW